MLSIQSGAGGTDSQDWAGMLLRMYKRFAERKGFKITTVDESPADFGIKSVDLRVDGPFAYGYLSGEKGTHRLVRISPFNALGKRQTSFAGVETWPILDDSEINDIEIPDKVRTAMTTKNPNGILVWNSHSCLLLGLGNHNDEVWWSRWTECQ
jgi:peptide chain release factor 2